MRKLALVLARPRRGVAGGHARRRHHLRGARRRGAPLRRVHDLLRPVRTGLVQLQRHAPRRRHLPHRRPLHLRRRLRRRRRRPTSGGNDVWVTFDETETLAGWPARADFPDEATLYAARSAWLNANPEYTKGTAIHAPDYDDFADFPVTHDVGVVELDEDASVTTYGVLAPLGAADTLAGSTGRGRNAATVETVGYGIQSVQPHPMEIESRFKSTSRIVEVNGNQSTGGNLHTSNNPSDAGGRGGSCFGDSGGPVFVNDTNQVLAVVSYGPSATCHGADYSWRVDTAAAHEFVGSFLD